MGDDDTAQLIACVLCFFSWSGSRSHAVKVDCPEQAPIPLRCTECESLTKYRRVSDDGAKIVVRAACIHPQTKGATSNDCVWFVKKGPSK